jgi:hypothetical protein
MKTFTIAAASALSLLWGASALAQTAPAPEAAATQAAPAAPDATPQAASAVPAPAAAAPSAEAKAHLIFFRPTRLAGALYTYHVVETGDDGKAPKDAQALGSLRNGGAFAYEAEPGIHDFNITGPMAVNKAEDRLRLELEPGQTYYVEQTVRMGLITGGFRLVPADEARFQATKVKLAQESK